jgi:hypothetical protein
VGVVVVVVGILLAYFHGFGAHTGSSIKVSTRPNRVTTDRQAIEH